MKLRLYAIALFLLSILSIQAQDIHFSQFYAAPLTLNPALTGNFNGLYRVTGIYRNQYPGADANRPTFGIFSTPSIGLDFSLLKTKKDGTPRMGALGVGAVFVNDQQNGKVFTNNHILGSVAYNMGFGPKRTFQLGLGIQGGIIMKKLDFAKLNFEQGYLPDPNGGSWLYNQSSVTETFDGSTKIKGALSAGLFTKVDFTKGLFYAGYSFNNITSPKEDYSGSTPAYKTPFRHTIHGGFEFNVKNSLVLIPGALFQLQSKATETNFGLTAGIHVIKNEDDPYKRATLFIGLWNRLNKSNYTIIPKVGFEYKGFRLGVAYDAHLTSQRSIASATGGAFPQAFEVTLSYIGRIFIPREDNFLFNPRY